MNSLFNIIYRRIYILLGLIAVLVFIYVSTHPLSNPGLEFYALLPFVYSVVILIFNNIFKYHIGGFGIKCFLIVTFFRYVILPCYSSYIGEIGVYNNLPASYYRYGIFISVIELFFSYYFINKCYLREYNRISQKLGNYKERYYNDLGYGGVIVLLFMIIIVVGRGHLGQILEMTRFFVVTDKFDKEGDLWTYDIWAIQVFLSFIVITTTSYFMKRNDKNENILNIIIPLTMAFLSCTIILTNNRMTMVYYALCGLCILNAAFPKRTKMLSSLMVGVMLIVIVSFTMMKNFGVEIGTGNASEITDEDGASALSAYVCGVDNMAHGVDMYMRNGAEYSIGGFFKTIHNFFMLSRLPLPIFDRSYFNQFDTAVELATESTEMVSVSTEVMFWAGGPILGCIIEILVLYIIVRLLVLFEVHTKLEFDLGKKYVYCWLSILFGIFMCYCIQTLWNNLTYMPLYLTFCLLINSKFKLNKTLINENKF